MLKHTSYYNFNSIASLREALHKKQISAVEIAKIYLDLIEKSSNLNCFLHINYNATMHQARLADKLINTGKAGPLTGIPIAHKDNYVTKEWFTTAASKILKNYLSPFNATVVDKLSSEGTICLGKLNCDEFAMGSSNENSAYGKVKNPWCENVIPGGSSGGSASAVAAGLVLAATGTDTGGSIRQPSAFCGVSGIKPTYGTVSRFGMIAFSSSFDQAGIIAKSSRELVDLIDTMSGFDEKDSTSLYKCNNALNSKGRIISDFNKTKIKFDKYNDHPLKELKIGLPKEFFDNRISSEVSNAIKQSLIKFEELGAEILEISIPNVELFVPTYYVISSAEASSNLARYDGIRYGFRAKNFSDINEMISNSRSEGFGSEVKKRIIFGTYVLSNKQYERFYIKAKKIRNVISQSFISTLNEKCDIIICPISSTVARESGVRSNSQIDDWLDDIYTLGASLSGLPALSIPCGFGGRNKNLPIGLQIIGKPFDEGFILAIADKYQQITDWHKQTPNYLGELK